MIGKVGILKAQIATYAQGLQKFPRSNLTKESQIQSTRMYNQMISYHAIPTSEMIAAFQTVAAIMTGNTILAGIFPSVGPSSSSSSSAY